MDATSTRRIATPALVVALLAGSFVVTTAAAPRASASTGIVDLGAIGGGTSEATAINDLGQVVGNFDSGSVDDAFSWTSAGGMVDLGTLGGPVTRASAVNNAGQVVGYSDTTNGQHAFSWSASGGIVDLGTVAGAVSDARAVNDAGQVVGESEYNAGASTEHPFLWTASRGMLDLTTLGGGTGVAATESSAVAINQDGQVVGGAGTARAFSWTAAGGSVDPGTFGGAYSGAAAVNDNGQVVGQAAELNGDEHAFSWTQSGGLVDLGTLGGAYSTAVAVSNNGQVVGMSTTGTTGDMHAFSWTASGGMIDLGALDGSEFSAASAVSNSGIVVGYSATSSGDQHAFAWTASTGMVDLGTLGGASSTAVAVNQNGQAVGYSLTTAGVKHATLWNVASALAPTTPSFEPDGNSVGPLTLVDATGNVVLGGNVNDSPLAAYAVGSTFGHPTGDDLATLYLCTPVQAVNSGSWNCDKLGSSTNDTATPAGVALPSGVPFNTGSPGDDTVATAISFAGANASNDTGVYQLRLVTSGPGQAANLRAHYDSVDIKVNGTGAGAAWSVVYPPQVDATATVVTANPPSPANSSTGAPVVVTFTASVTPATSALTSGAVGTVEFFNGNTQIGTTQLISGTRLYAAAITVVEPDFSDSSVTAKFVPYNGTTLEASTSAALPYHVSTGLDSTDISLTINQDGYAGDTVTYDSVVGVSPGATCAGSVSFYDTSTLVAGPITVGPAVPCEAHATSIFTAAGSHSITAVFTPPAGSTTLIGSTSPAISFTQTAHGLGDCSTPSVGGCTDTQSVQGTVPAGVLTISTPYTAAAPLDLGTLSLDPSGTYFTGSAPFGVATSAATEILVTDTRAGDLPWTTQAQASALSDGGSNPGSTISGENVGLTGLTVVPVPGNGFDAAPSNLTATANPAAAPPVGPIDPGSQGLGNAAHDFAQAQQGFGSIGLTGILTLNAPSSTEAGLFTGTLTFTIVGDLQ